MDISAKLDGLVQDDAERGHRHRQADAQFAERSHEPCHVPALVHEAGVPHLAHFVDAVSELEAAILYMDTSVAMGPVKCGTMPTKCVSQIAAIFIISVMPPTLGRVART